jgi:hypothetical protein
MPCSDDDIACSTQRTGDLCGHTYYCEFGPPLPPCYEDMIGEAFELRFEKEIDEEEDPEERDRRRVQMLGISLGLIPEEP